MDSSAQYLMLPRREDFRDILEERRTSSDLSHALKSFSPMSSRASPPCSASTLNKTVLESQHLHYIMQEVSRDTGEPLETIREEAAGILEEMSQDLQLGYIRFLGFILSKVFKRLFRKINVNEEGLQRLQQAMQESPVVLMPNHRSYVDFLVLSYLLFTYDLSIPVIAAGIRKYLLHDCILHHWGSFIFQLQRAGFPKDPFNYQLLFVPWNISCVSTKSLFCGTLNRCFSRRNALGPLRRPSIFNCLPRCSHCLPALMGMQLIGEILRRSGAFFIRRSIGTNKLYWAVLSEYVKTILRKDFAPVEFYVEGLRSRTLKSLPPKLGMMHMVLEPFFKGEVYDISLVPISISYDRVVEESLLAYELLGVPKPKETTVGLLKARKVMDEDYGSMHVCFGHPLSVRNLAKGKVNRNQYNLIPRDLPMKPSESIHVFANTTAHVVLRLQQENMVLSPWSLMATILMQNLGGINLKLLTKQTVWLKWLVLDFGALIDWPVQVADSEVMSSSLSLHHSVVRCEGDQVFLVEQTPQRGAGPEEAVFRRAVAVLMCASYRNQALHVLASPAMLAVALSLAAASSRADIYNLYAFLREMFYNEFVFIPDRTGQDFEEACSLLQKCGTVQITNQDITVTDKGLSVTSFLTAVVEPFIDAYQVIFRYICSRSVQEFTEKQFISGIRTFTLNLILTGEVKSYDVLSSDTQKNALASLVRLNALTKKKREEQTYFSPNKAALGRTADILAGKIPPQARTYSRL